MGLAFSRRLLCSAIGMAVASQGQAAAIRLDAFVDGEPAAVAEVLLDNQPIGGSRAGESFWYDELAGGRYQLQLSIAGESIAYEFSVSADQVAVITVNRASASGESTKSLQRINLSEFNTAQGGEGVTIAPSAEDSLSPGLIQGSVVSEENEAPVRNVAVGVVGGDQQTVTDRYGNFELELPAGVYELQLEHADYRSSRLKALRVLPKMNLAVDVQLSAADVFEDAPGGGAIEEVQVMGRYSPGNPIEIERISSSVVDSIDFTQIARFDDSMVSSALKRVVGVSLEDDRYPIVRGMKSRYQSTDFNGATLPSTDPARRDLPLDIFPAGIMQGLSLQKSATADIPSSATAGHISMRTKDIPDEAFFKMSYSATRGDMHGDDMLMSSTEGDRDWLGMDDGSRDIPDILAPTIGTWLDLKTVDGNDPNAYNDEQTEAMGESLQHNAITSGEAQLDSSLSFSSGRSWDISDQQFGVIGALRYGNKWSNNTKTNYRFGLVGDDVIVTGADETQDTNNVIDLSGMLNLQWEFSDRHQLGLNNIALRHTTNSAELVSGYSISETFSPEQLLNISELEKSSASINRISRQRVDWIEEQLLSHQLWGEHSLDVSLGQPWLSRLGDLEVDWQVNRASTEYDRPNATQYTYSTGTTNSLRLQSGAAVSYSLWELMEEENNSYRVDFDLPIEDVYGATLNIKAGMQDLQRERDGYNYRYHLNGYGGSEQEVEYIKHLENPDPRQVYDPEFIHGVPKHFALSIGSVINPDTDTGLAGDSYVVDLNAEAAYALVEADIAEKLKINMGVRRESFVLDAEQYAYTPEPMVNLLDEERTSPSIGLTYLFSDAWQLRMAYSETVSWPEIFEVLPRRFIDVETLERYTGNPELKPADIKNTDLRLEWYPSDTESVTLALFSKDITNAIENRFYGGFEEFDFYTFENSESAEVTGVELDLRKEFVFGRNQGHELFVQFNYTDITSSVEVTEGTGIAEYDTERPLQGQPDYIANLQLGYDHIDSGQEVTLVFNRKGEELAIVVPKVSRSLTNVYEKPYSDLRLIYKKNFLNGLSLSASIDNLLDEERSLEYEQYDLPYLRYSSGRKFKLKASYSF